MTRSQLVGIFLAIFCLLGMTGFLVFSAKFYYLHPEGDRLHVTRDGRVMVRPPGEKPEAEIVTVSSPAPSRPRVHPSAVIDEPVHDFGTMNPLTIGKHVFVVRNEGEAPLKLAQGPTTCKCTLSEVARDAIPPGESAEVELEWNSGRDRLYFHNAVVFTNDPKKREITLRVEGLVRTRLAVDPDSMDFGTKKFAQSAESSVVLYSQVWKDFGIDDASFTSEGFTWKLVPVGPEVKRAYDATQAYHFIVNTPKEVTANVGRFNEDVTLQLSGTSEDGEVTTEELQVHLGGSTEGRLAVFGPGVQHDGIVDFDHIPYRKGAKKRAIVKIRDEEKAISLTGFNADPDFVSVTLSPVQGSPKETGLYNLDIEIPSDAPVCSYVGVTMGRLKMEFDHPRIKKLELQLKFAIVDR